MSTQKSNSIKQFVSERYGKIAKATNKSEGEEGSCCGPTCCGDQSESDKSNQAQDLSKASASTIANKINLPDGEVGYSVAESYADLKGYNAEADLGLGCGLPTKEANIQAGDTVLDLGSGAGNDCFIAMEETGETGHVIGLDFSEDMIALAKKNAKKRDQKNLSFIHGEIEEIPLPKETVDVVISNCVMNLVPDKNKAYEEVFRVLKKGGHFSISDIVSEGKIPLELRDRPELYAECLSGASEINSYQQVIKDAGFTNTRIERKKELLIPEEVIKAALPENLYTVYKGADFKLFSITINAEKH